MNVKNIDTLQKKLLSGSAVSGIIPAAGSELLPKIDDVLSVEDIRHDTSTIARVLINGYCGWPFLDELTKRSILEKLSKIYDNVVQMTTLGYFDLLKPIFQKIPDNHIGLILKGERASSTMGHKIKNVGQNLASREQKFTIKMDGDISVIAVSTLSNWTSEQEKEFVDTAKDFISKGSAVIIDLRGNGGGRDVPMTKIAEFLYGTKTQSCVRSYIRTTPEATIIQNQSPNPNWSTLDKSKDPTLWHDFSKEPYPEFAGVRKPIYVLIDAGVASSAEMFITRLKRHPWMKLVGDNTKGCEVFGWMRAVILPNSKMTLRVGNVYRELEQSNFELNGYKPDISVEEGQDAYNIAKMDYESNPNIKI